MLPSGGLDHIQNLNDEDHARLVKQSSPPEWQNTKGTNLLTNFQMTDAEPFKSLSPEEEVKMPPRQDNRDHGPAPFQNDLFGRRSMNAR